MTASRDPADPSDRYSDLIARARHRLAGYRRAELDLDDWNPAAVLLLLYRTAGTEHIVLTVRSSLVEHHRGQISFPGGAVHPADADREMTAVRETYEEIGVAIDAIEPIGRLDDIVTVSDFHVTPVVGVLSGGPPEFRPSPDEVAEVLEIPLRHLLDPANVGVDRRQRNGITVEHPVYAFENFRVWGATARILSNLLALLAEPPADSLEEERPT